jgi:uncharacterized protein (UPF0248 family)
MMQDEQIQSFITSQTADWLKEDLQVMDQELLLDKEKITEDLVIVLNRIFRQTYDLQQIGKKGPAAYLCISFLRTNLLEDNWEYRLDIYDDKVYLDSVECVETWELNFVWKHLKRRMSELGETIKHSLYANKVRAHHLNQIKMTMAEKYQQAAILLTGRLLPKAIEQINLAGISKVSVFTILMGEYRDHSVPLHKVRYEAKEKEETLCNTSE